MYLVCPYGDGISTPVGDASVKGGTPLPYTVAEEENTADGRRLADRTQEDTQTH